MRSITRRYWKKPQPFMIKDQTRDLAENFKVAPEIIAMLENRGLNDSGKIEKFLYPTLQDIADPFNMKDMVKACKLVHQAITDGHDIIIWGDYDVDGVTATALLLRFFNELKANLHWFIPNRFIHGYGLEITELKKLTEKVSSAKPLLITVDCGITNVDEVAYAKQLGYKVIVTDHHEPGHIEVSADAVLNVKQENCEFSDKNLAGVGIAFYLAMGVRAYLNKINFFDDSHVIPNMKKLLELVAIGTIADMVELQGLNRVLVKAGFEVIDNSPSPGVAALLKESDVVAATITSEDIAFQLAPKINAAGRMDEAGLAVQLLIENDSLKTTKLAKKLSSLNKRRKKTCADCLESTLSNYYIEPEKHKNCVIIKTEHSIGVLGIVASQLAEKLRVPVIIVAEATDKNYGKVLKGSCRSVIGIDIHEALQNSDGTLLQYGGHKMAAGLTLYESELQKFTDEISFFLQSLEERQPEYEIIDIELDVERVLEEDILKQIQLLEPFGVGNAKPIFFNRKLEINEIRRIGKTGDHLTFLTRGKFENKKCIGFKFGDYEQELKGRADIDLLYTVSISRFKKAVRWQAQVVDIV